MIPLPAVGTGSLPTSQTDVTDDTQNADGSTDFAELLAALVIASNLVPVPAPPPVVPESAPSSAAMPTTAQPIEVAAPLPASIFTSFPALFAESIKSAALATESAAQPKYLPTAPLIQDTSTPAEMTLLALAAFPMPEMHLPATTTASAVQQPLALTESKIAVPMGDGTSTNDTNVKEAPAPPILQPRELVTNDALALQSVAAQPTVKMTPPPPSLPAPAFTLQLTHTEWATVQVTSTQPTGKAFNATTVAAASFSQLTLSSHGNLGLVPLAPAKDWTSGEEAASSDDTATPEEVSATRSAALLSPPRPEAVATPDTKEPRHVSDAPRPVIDQIHAGIVDRLHVLRVGERTEVQIDLNPPSLGRVRVELTLVETKHLEVRLFSPVDAARETISQHLDGLRHRLTELGLHLGSCDLHDGQSSPERDAQRQLHPDDDAPRQSKRRQSVWPSSRGAVINIVA